MRTSQEPEQLVIQRSKDRRFIPNAQPNTQLLKAFSETGELVAVAEERLQECRT